MILVSGSFAFDQIMDFSGIFSDHIMPERIHTLNLSFLVNKMRKSFGGTAGNISYSLSLLGIKVAVVGAVGGDFREYKKFLDKNGIDTSLIKIYKRDFTSSAFGITDRKDNQIWGFYTGADRMTHKLSVSSVGKDVDFAIVAPNNPKAMMKFIAEYQKLKVPYMFDPGMQLPWFSKKDLLSAFSQAKIIIGNDYETSLMEEKTKVSSLHSLSKQKKIIITTLGEKGSKISFQGKTINIRSVLVADPADPTGAGDAYRAGFMAGYIRNLPLRVCGRMGSLAAFYTVGLYGTMTHRFTLDEFGRKYKEVFGDSLKL